MSNGKFEHRPNSGTAFHNDKRTSDNAPSWKGSGLIDGKEYDISIWVKPTKTGGKWLSLAFQESGAWQSNGEAPRKQQEPSRKPAQPNAQDFDDEIPF